MWLLVCLVELLEQIGLKDKTKVEILCDNNSTIWLSKHPVFYEKNKHVDLKIHFLWDLRMEQSS